MSAEANELTVRRARRISAEDVFVAADALLIEGHRPTIDRVRIRLGRGSPNTINEHLDRWWEHLGARLRELPGGALPGVPEPVATSLVQLWSVALREAQLALRTTLEEREGALQAAQESFERQRSQLKARESTWDETRTALERAREAAEQQAALARQRADELVAAMARREAHLTDIEGQLAQAREQVDTLHQHLQQETAARISDRQKLEERSAAAEARALREIDRARQQRKDDLKEATATQKALRAELHAQRQAREAADKNASALQQRLLQLESVAQERARQLERLQTAAVSRPRQSPKRARGSGLARK